MKTRGQKISEAKTKNLDDLQIVKNLSKLLSSDKVFQEFRAYIEANRDKGNLSRKYKVIENIFDTHGECKLFDLFQEYYETKSHKRKHYLLYGDAGLKSLVETYKSRKQPENRKTCLMIEFWTERGYSESEAKAKISSIQSQNAKKRDAKSYTDQKQNMRHCLAYWLHRGYSEREAEILRQPYKQAGQDKEWFIAKYGKKEGERIHREKYEKQRKTRERNKSSQKSGGYVSKESLKFFIPLYKACRKIGISRKDIYLGIEGSREFFIRHHGRENSGRFFDFAIPSLNLIVEYNGLFWHPRTREEWKNPWTTYDDAMSVEEEKQRLCDSRSYDLEVVWSDDYLSEKLEYLTDLIRERYEQTI